MPSSNTLSDSSSGRLPPSRALTICSSRVRQSSNLRSLITLLCRVHATVEASFVQQHAHCVADGDVAPAPHDEAVGGAREAVLPNEYRKPGQVTVYDRLR